MKVVILTEGGPKIGRGHLSRAGSLAAAFRRRGCDLAMAAGGDAGEMLGAADQECVLMDWASDADRLAKTLTGADVAVVDSYHAGRAVYQQIADAVPLGVWLDDHLRLDYPPGVVINGALTAAHLRYPTGAGRTYLLGARYLTLREAFWDAPLRQVRPAAQSVLLTLGADDPRGLTPQILARLSAALPGIDKHIVIGPWFRGDVAIEAAADNNTTLHDAPDAGAMCELMRQTDMAVSAGGQTLCELAATAAATEAICLGENQRANLQGWKDAGIIDFVDIDIDPDWLDALTAAVRGMLPEAERARRAEIAREIMNGCGALNVADTVLRILSARDNGSDLALRDAAEDDAYDLWVWRNHPDVRRGSFDTRAIPYSGHRQWFHRQLADTSTMLYIAEDTCGLKAGQIRFDTDDARTLVSVCLNPTHFGRGLGRKLIAMGTQRFTAEHPGRTTVTAEIIEDNTASLKAFEHAGYTRVGQIDKAGASAAVYEYTA